MKGIRLPAPKVFTNHQIILALFFWILHSFNKLCSKVSCFLILEGSFNFQTLLLNTWGGGVVDEWVGGDTPHTHWQVNDPETGLELTAGVQLRPRIGM